MVYRLISWGGYPPNVTEKLHVGHCKVATLMPAEAGIPGKQELRMNYRGIMSLAHSMEHGLLPISALTSL